MPSLSSSSSSVFGKFRRQASDPTTQQSQQSPPAVPTASHTSSPFASPERSRSRVGRDGPGHRRDSSILSISGALDLGASVRRSVSLRGHRSQASSGGGSLQGHKARFPSNGSRITLAGNLQESPIEDETPTALPQPPPSRGKLSIAGRSISQKLKSTETLPIYPTQEFTSNDRPPQTANAEENHRNPFHMLATQPAFRLERRQTDRPSLSTNPSFIREHSNASTNNMSIPLSATTTPLSAGGHDTQAIYRQIHEVSTKRMATLEYMRKAHEGDIYYFNTLRYTPQSLAQLPSLHPHKLGRRATQFLVLGYSLPALLDLNSGSALEYLKAFSGVLQEFETYQHLSAEGGSSGLSRGRVGQMFKSSMGLGTRSGKGRRSSAATDALSVSSADTGISGIQSTNSGSSALDAYSPIHITAHHDFHYLITPHLPFDPDFATTFSTLCDALIDAYNYLLDLIAKPEDCAPGVSEAFAKTDKAVRKILISSVQREFEDSTRAGVKGEVAGLGRLVLGGLM